MLKPARLFLIMALAALLGLFAFGISSFTATAAPSMQQVAKHQANPPDPVTTDVSQIQRYHAQLMVAAAHAQLVADLNAAYQAFQAAYAQQAAQQHQYVAPVRQSSSYSAPSGGNAAIWACIVQHESGGDPTAMNASGAAGLYQFMPGTWQSASGMGGSAADYSAAQQTQAAYSYEAANGWSAWYGDGCTPGG